MKKEELLRVFSAYLPYKTGITLASEEYNYDGLTTILSPHYLLDWQRNKCKITLHLYDLSHLIEDEFNFIWEDEIDFESLEQFISLDWESRLTCRFSYSFWTELFKNHFNVFGLKEGEYINKATLNHGNSESNNKIS